MILRCFLFKIIEITCTNKEFKPFFVNINYNTDYEHQCYDFLALGSFLRNLFHQNINQTSFFVT